jgi:hypothetical protein
MLSIAEKNSIAAIAQREGGWDALIPQILDALVAERKQAALSALADAISVTVTDRAKVAAVFAAASQHRIALRDALADLVAAWQAGDDSQLGPRLVLVAAAAKGHLGI